MPAGAAACCLLPAASFLAPFLAWAEAARSGLHSPAQASEHNAIVAHHLMAGPVHSTFVQPSGTHKRSDMRQA